MKSFADKLTELRGELGITKPEAAQLLGGEVPVSQRTFWDWEAGKSIPYTVTQEGVLARLRSQRELMNRALGAPEGLR